jgi:hypothetical protein
LRAFVVVHSVLSSIARRRKSTIRKPSALSAMLANDFENRAVHNPPDQKEMEAH